MELRPGRSLLIPLGGILAAIFLLLIPLPFGMDSGTGPFGEALKDALHFPLFVLLTYLLFLFFRRVMSVRSRLGILAATGGTAIVVAGLTEWTQAFTGRSASGGDFLNNALGVASCLIGIVAFQKDARVRSRMLFPALIVIVAATAFVLAPVTSAWRAESAQRRLFPDLAGFGEVDALLFWHPQGITDGGKSTSIALSLGTGDSDSSVLLVHCAPAAWSGVSRFLPIGTRDWRSFSALSLNVENTGPPFALGIRVDGSDCRYSAQVRLATGSNPIILPFESNSWQPASPSAECLSEITKVLFHTGESPVAHPFVLTDIRLVTKP